MSLDSICICKNKATPTDRHLECNGPMGSSSTCSAWSTSADPIIVLIGRAIDARQAEVEKPRLSSSGKLISRISSPVQNQQSAIATPQTNSAAPKLQSFKVDNDSDSKISYGSWNLYRRPLQKQTNMLPCQLLVWLWPNSVTHRLAHLWQYNKHTFVCKESTLLLKEFKAQCMVEREILTSCRVNLYKFYILAQVELRRLPLIWEGLNQYDLSHSAKDVLMALCRKGNSKQYQTYLTKWQQYCRERNIEVLEPGITNGIEFIVSLYRAGLGYSVMNTARPLSFLWRMESRLDNTH